MMKTWPDKHPDSALDYVFDWSAWLAGDTIVSFSTITEGFDALLIVESEDETAPGVITVFLSGGTPNHTYEVSCGILTDLGREEIMTARLPVRDPA